KLRQAASIVLAMGGVYNTIRCHGHQIMESERCAKKLARHRKVRKNAELRCCWRGSEYTVLCRIPSCNERRRSEFAWRWAPREERFCDRYCAMRSGISSGAQGFVPRPNAGTSRGLNNVPFSLLGRASKD